MREDIEQTLKRLQLTAKRARVFGVDYLHVTIPDEGDLYVTKLGEPFLENLLPSNWRDDEYYNQPANRHLKVRLEGSSNPFRITTKPVNGRRIDIVVKWCRVGQDVILDMSGSHAFMDDEASLPARWNSPFEEFGLLMELRSTNRFYHPPLLTQRPLAIFTPNERVELWQTGRSKHKMQFHNALLREDQEEMGSWEPIELDIQRLYALIYGWVKGESAPELFRRLGLPTEELARLTRGAYVEFLRNRGYTVLDTKPEHLIVREQNGKLLTNRRQRPVFAMIDFELLQRTTTYERVFQRAQRAKYWHLLMQRDREDIPLPEDLSRMEVFGVKYVHGIATNRGKLWVVGSHPGLFDYYDPSRWRRTPRIQLSTITFRTRTLDNIQIVYRLARVGMKPQQDPISESGRKAREFGFNSPFEEVAIAEELRRLGIPTVYPRAIYRTDHQSLPAEWISDNSRYESHRPFRTPDGAPLLESNHDYFTLWGYWRGIDPTKGYGESVHWGMTEVAQAFEEGLITRREYERVIETTQNRLARLGFTGSISQDRFLLYIEKGEVLRDEHGDPAVTLSVNGYRAFELRLLNMDEYLAMIQHTQERLLQHGYEPLNLKGDHLLLSLDPDGRVKRDAEGHIEIVLCKFEQIRAPWMNY